MTKKITPQELFQVAVACYSDEERKRWRLPETWEALSEHDKVIFTRMAFKTNCIVGEMEVEVEAK